MGAPQASDHRRYVILALVLSAHLALLAALLSLPHPESAPGSAANPLKLLYLPPTPAAKIRPTNFRPQRLGLDTLVSIAPPVPGSLDMAPASSGADGNGLGVDWPAEARRAVQAFEIRNTKDSNSPAPSRVTIADEWWPWAQHHAGEEYKTAGGDWIVWINSSCYQIARAKSPDAGLGTVIPETVCPDKAAKPRTTASPAG